MPNETKSKDESDNAERMEVWDVDKDLQEDPYRLEGDTPEDREKPSPNGLLTFLLMQSDIKYWMKQGYSAAEAEAKVGEET